MRLGVFGGTFSPPHAGHIAAAKRFVCECRLDKLLVIPAFIPPHKELGERAPSPLQREEMARLAFSPLGKEVEISDVEIKRGGKSYTYETLRMLDGYDELFLLCGTDMFMCFDTWYRFEDIFHMCTLAVCERYDDSPEERRRLEEKAEFFKNAYGAKTIILSGKIMPASSTDIREMIKRGDDVSDVVGKEVSEYIKKKELYR